MSNQKAPKNSNFKRIVNRQEPAPAPKPPKKRANIFSKSRDVREDRSARQNKTTHNSRTISRSR